MAKSSDIYNEINSLRNGLDLENRQLQELYNRAQQVKNKVIDWQNRIDRKAQEAKAAEAQEAREAEQQRRQAEAAMQRAAA